MSSPGLEARRRAAIEARLCEVTVFKTSKRSDTFHEDPDCRRSRLIYPIPFPQAIDEGLTPCGLCVVSFEVVTPEREPAHPPP